ncbi:MAG TPA: exosortase/archaeosortase family protein, partial [Pirellulaceae bacterium]|nr:exosortase/archaeosortase family protein [Pirellulaceae bacterium]
GNVILLGEHTLEVEQACAGLRIFMGIGAVAFAWAVASTEGWLHRAILLGSALPVAISANILRIVGTALCFVYGSQSFATAVAHDAAGWLMVPLAMLLIACIAWYLKRLIVETTEVRMANIIELQRTRPR